MSESYPMPLPTKDFHAAKRQFVELYGSLAVMNTYLKIAVLEADHRRPLVIERDRDQFDDVGAKPDWRNALGGRRCGGEHQCRQESCESHQCIPH